MTKNGQVHEGGKVGRSKVTPTKLFSVDSYDLKSMSFRFGNDIFITYYFGKKHFVAIPSICNQRSLLKDTLKKQLPTATLSVKLSDFNSFNSKLKKYQLIFVST